MMVSKSLNLCHFNICCSISLFFYHYTLNFCIQLVYSSISSSFQKWNLLPHSKGLLFHIKMVRLSFFLTAVERRISMSKYIPGNQKHLSLEDRIYIENELNKGETFKNIARFLCKDPTTISKEVRAHRLSDWYHKGTFYNAHNFCIHRFQSRYKHDKT